MHGSSGCFGCYHKPQLISSADEPVRWQKSQNQASADLRISKDFWSTGTCDMDNSAVPSRGSLSSISTSTQMHDSHGTGSSNTPPEFVNHGLLLWNQIRQQWVAHKKPEEQNPQLREPKLSKFGLWIAKKFWLCSWNATYESLLGNNKPFPKPIPLPEMIDFLVDVWEQEGMYDD